MSYTFKVTKKEISEVKKLDFDNIPFGKVFTDHMFMMDYIDGQWTNFEIRPVEEIPTHPGNLAWHYGQSIFEGMKATRDEAGTPLLFRPEMHSQRINASARRMCMPEIPEDLFLKAVHHIVAMESAWIPPQAGSALYIRPFMYATDHTIGVRPSDTYKFIIFTMPVGPYYTKPVKLWAQDTYVRAVVGGVGEAKTAGNYAASLMPARMAVKEGYDQVMWLDAIHKKYVQEVGTMNIFFVINDEIITPELDGAILAGITRDSLIRILKDHGYKVTERPITIDEVIEAGENGQLTEIFGSGTAAVISAVSHLKYNDKVITLDTDKRPIGSWAYQYVNGLRNRTIEDTNGWVIPANSEF